MGVLVTVALAVAVTAYPAVVAGHGTAKSSDMPNMNGEYPFSTTPGGTPGRFPKQCRSLSLSLPLSQTNTTSLHDALLAAARLVLRVVFAPVMLCMM
jgi:hypothetical protein